MIVKRRLNYELASWLLSDDVMVYIPYATPIPRKSEYDTGMSVIFAG